MDRITNVKRQRVDYLYMNFQNITRILSSQQEALAMRVNLLRENSSVQMLCEKYDLSEPQCGEILPLVY